MFDRSEFNSSLLFINDADKKTFPDKFVGIGQSSYHQLVTMCKALHIKPEDYAGKSHSSLVHLISKTQGIPEATCDDSFCYAPDCDDLEYDDSEEDLESSKSTP